MKKLMFILLLAIACGGKEPRESAATKSQGPGSLPPPTPVEAREIVASSPEWSDFMFTSATWTLPTSLAGMHEKNKLLADQLVEGGWIRYEGDEVILTDKGFNDKRLVMRPNNVIDIMPLAQKELLEVTGVSADPNEPVVSFTWRWKPNEIGATLKSGMFVERFAKTYSATAKLYRVGDKWGVMSIKAADAPPA